MRSLSVPWNSRFFIMDCFFQVNMACFLVDELWSTEAMQHDQHATSQWRNVSYPQVGLEVSWGLCSCSQIRTIWPLFVGSCSLWFTSGGKLKRWPWPNHPEFLGFWPSHKIFFSNGNGSTRFRKKVDLFFVFRFFSIYLRGFKDTHTPPL